MILPDVVGRSGADGNQLLPIRGMPQKLGLHPTAHVESCLQDRLPHPGKLPENPRKMIRIDVSVAILIEKTADGEGILDGGSSALAGEGQQWMGRIADQQHITTMECLR